MNFNTTACKNNFFVEDSGLNGFQRPLLNTFCSNLTGLNITQCDPNDSGISGPFLHSPFSANFSLQMDFAIPRLYNDTLFLLTLSNPDVLDDENPFTSPSFSFFIKHDPDINTTIPLNFDPQNDSSLVDRWTDNFFFGIQGSAETTRTGFCNRFEMLFNTRLFQSQTFRDIVDYLQLENRTFDQDSIFVQLDFFAIFNASTRTHSSPWAQLTLSMNNLTIEGNAFAFVEAWPSEVGIYKYLFGTTNQTRFHLGCNHRSKPGVAIKRLSVLQF